MKLYYFKGACSMVPHIALEWIGQPYEAEEISFEQSKSAAYLALNPQGAVPLLQDGEFYLSQNVAILSYLAELYPAANLFGKGDAKARATALKWLLFCNADLHKLFKPLFRPADYLANDEALKLAAQNEAKAQILASLAIANNQLAHQDYLAGELSVADAYFYVLLRWCKGLNIDFSHLTQLEPFYQRISQNAGVKSVLAQEQLEP
ncbi:MAG: glutathione S-transferase N-terminal domain-containing protein [Pasteurellaceae bacterium]|nr:glutathione S-transferase N-terminal domain-containing protein [Pasteurellaceae bacterium]